MTTLTAEWHDNVLVLTLDRTERRNAMNLEMARAFHAALETADDAAAIVLTGAGGTFSAGADIKDGSGVGSEGVTWFEAFDRFTALDVPSVAAIEGWCLGGGLELALCCDLRVAARTARLGTPEVKHGVFPAGGGTQRLGPIVGDACAKELLFLGEWITADTAGAWGLVNRVVAEGDALGVAVQLASTIASHPRDALRSMKRLTRSPQLVAGLDRERAEIAALLGGRSTGGAH